jgi:hypothetical protein
LTNATTIIPDSLVSHQMLALAYEKAGKTDSLLNKLAYIRDLSPGVQSNTFHERIARALLEEGQTDSAYTYFRSHPEAFRENHAIPGVLT